MGKKVISFGLSEQDIDRALKELEQYKQEIIQKTNLLREKVAQRLADESQSGFAQAVSDTIVLKGGSVVDLHSQVDVSVDNRGSVTVVIASGEDAIWIEFGSGVYYNGSPGTSPHPSGAELGFVVDMETVMVRRKCGVTRTRQENLSLLTVHQPPCL